MTHKVKIGIGEIHYTPEELEKEIMDFIILKDAFLVVLNPEVAERYDMAYNKEKAIELARKIYEGTGYAPSFIDQIFEKGEKGISKLYVSARKNDIRLILIRHIRNMGMDNPQNIEEIVDWIYEDVCETADEENWNDQDVIIGFRRWMES